MDQRDTTNFSFSATFGKTRVADSAHPGVLQEPEKSYTPKNSTSRSYKRGADVAIESLRYTQISGRTDAESNE